MKLLFATHNRHKVEEVLQILAHTDVQLVTLADTGFTEDPPETSDTFEGNALQKARWVYERTGQLCVADDSGLEVDALGGRPGVHSKRYSPEALPGPNNQLLLSELAGIEDRVARFRCVIAVVGAGVERTAEGRCEGRIAHALQGDGGFGYDPLFLADETPGRSLAELSMDDKNAISHRGRAFRKLPDLLEGLL
ncbi:MAG: RdgB/HAM1 family non-canonical purine NTP pyrophosphatase [Myxococcales bacterium]|nr:RdgB/HAM1 family non-canonical purine NTP pyrophosphatase [Myxococcales bacterium]